MVRIGTTIERLERLDPLSQFVAFRVGEIIPAKKEFFFPLLRGNKFVELGEEGVQRLAGEHRWPHAVFRRLIASPRSVSTRQEARSEFGKPSALAGTVFGIEVLLDLGITSECPRFREGEGHAGHGGDGERPISGLYPDHGRHDRSLEAGIGRAQKLANRLCIEPAGDLLGRRDGEDVASDIESGRAL